MYVRSTGLVTEEEPKRLQFTKRKRKMKKHDTRTETKCEGDETSKQPDIVRTFFQSPKG